MEVGGWVQVSLGACFVLENRPKITLNQYWYFGVVYHMYSVCIRYTSDGQPPARGPDPAHEGLTSGPPPCSAITLQSGPRNPSQKMPVSWAELCSQCRESWCKLWRSLIKYKNWKTVNHCFHSGMLAEQHVFSLMGGRTFVWSNAPWIPPVLSAGRPTVPQRWLGRRRAPLRCWCATVRPLDTPSPYTRCAESFTNKRLCTPSMPTSLTSCLLWWRSSAPSSHAASIIASSKHWLTGLTCSTAICFTFAKFAGWIEEPCCLVCVPCGRRSPPFVVRRIFPMNWMMNWRWGSTTLLLCSSSATSPSLLGIFLNTN